ncbi:MAG: winged helix-turn-helix transcriptional regulator [Armatimonadetes bacterium]|nr:winged helix-turn-helix transcriptional regulator [Armatimonadota bacterium]
MTTMSIGSALFGGVRQAVLAILFCHSDESFHLRHIVRAVGMGHGAVQRELARLVDAGLVIRSRRGNQVLYKANKESPVFAELRGLMVKTVGIADVLRASLAALSDRIEVAFMYGSVARGTERVNRRTSMTLLRA